MEQLSWESAVFYWLFAGFRHFQQWHAKSAPEEEGELFAKTLYCSVILARITGISYLVYYGWSVVWWAPVIIGVLGILSSFTFPFIRRHVTDMDVSLCGFIGWPICAFLMFYFIPKALR